MKPTTLVLAGVLATVAADSVSEKSGRTLAQRVSDLGKRFREVERLLGDEGRLLERRFTALEETLQGLRRNVDRMKGEGVAGRVTALEQDLGQISGELAQLRDDVTGVADTARRHQRILRYFSLGDMQTTRDATVRVLRIRDVNVQIFSETPSTGNLIIGDPGPMFEPGFYALDRTGSHNLIMGVDHDWKGSQCLITGRMHRVDGDGNAIIGGIGNVVDGLHNVIVSGVSNAITGQSEAALITGGKENWIQNTWSGTLLGGWQRGICSPNDGGCVKLFPILNTCAELCE